MSKPILYVFTISHYCEKARWALEHAGVAYHLQVLLPGAHIALTKKLGLKSSSLPVLAIGERVIQGSAAILDWADSQRGKDKPSIAVADDSEGAQQIEDRLDSVLGVHIRRLFYSEALVDYPETVKPVFAQGLSMLERIKLSLMWPMVRKKMIAKMDLGADQFEESRAIVETELDWLDGLLADQRSYLAGGQFSRVDITAASLMAPAVLPPNHPAISVLTLTPGVKKLAAIWRQRPVFQWLEGIYARHRP